MIKIYLKVQHINIVNIYLVVKEIYTIVHVALSWGLKLNTEKFCVIHFAFKKSFIKRLDIAQFGSYFVCGGLSTIST